MSQFDREAGKGDKSLLPVPLASSGPRRIGCPPTGRAIYVTTPSLQMLCVLSLCSRVQLFATLGTAACRAPLLMGFSRQEYCSGLLRPPPGDLPDPETKPRSFKPPALAGGFFTTSATWEALQMLISPANTFTDKPRNNSSGHTVVRQVDTWV